MLEAKIETLSLMRRGAIVLAFLGLTGCYTGRVVVGDPQWQMSFHPAENCKSIDGKYLDGDLLLGQLQDPYFPKRPPEEKRYSDGIQFLSAPANSSGLYLEIKKQNKDGRSRWLGKMA